MNCCGGGCCWWKKKQAHSAPKHDQHFSLPSTNPPVESGEEPSSSSSSTMSVDVLKSFQEADIDKADDFINAIQQQLNPQDTPSTSSSNTDKLSNWTSYIQSGATFLKFASDHTEKIHNKGDFSQSGEVTKIVGEILQQIGQLHWAVAGFSIVGYLVSKCQQVSDNRTGYVDLLKEMFKLASHIKRVYDLSLEYKNQENLKNAFQYIVEGSMYCASQLELGIFSSFLKTSRNSGTLSSVRSKIDSIYRDLQSIVEIETLAQHATILPLSQPRYPKNAVGIEEQVEAVNMLLNMNNNNNNEDQSSTAVVIWGFGGIGKTTLAKAVVSTIDRKSYNYARIELDQDSDKNNYRVMQKQILKDAFPSYNGGREVKLRDDSDGRDKLAEAFQSEMNKPVFLFIDNALHKEDLEKILPEDLQGLPQRSRLLITTRILNVTDVLHGITRKDYPVKTLPDSHAAEVLCSDPVIPDRIEDDIKKMVKLCGGIPLVLKIVGARLSKQNYDVERCTQIREALESGGNIKQDDLSNRLLNFVYDQLEESTKEAFLDICCFFAKGFPRRVAEYIVGAEEVASLQEAALITTVIGMPRFLGNLCPRANSLAFLKENLNFNTMSEEEELLSIHDIIQSMGRNYSQSSRIMDSNSWGKIEKDEGKFKGIRGIWLYDIDCVLKRNHLNLMKDTLRILVMRGGSIGVSGTDEDAVSFPELRYMRIAGDISWMDVEALDKLAVLECEKLPGKQNGPLKLPASLRSVKVACQPAVMQDFMPNSSLEELDITFNEDGVRDDKESCAFYSRLGGLNKLKILRVRNCLSLRGLTEDVRGLRELNRLSITWCSNLERLSESFGQLKALTELNLTECTGLEELPESFGQLKALTELYLSCCTGLKELPESFGQLKALKELYLSHCTGLKELPESFGQLKALTELNLLDCRGLEELPESFGQLKALTELNLTGCTGLKELPESFGQLKALTELKLLWCTDLKELPESFGQLKALTELNLSCCTGLKELPESFGQLKALTRLYLSQCTDLKELPESFGQLKALTRLDLSHYRDLKELPESFGQLKALTRLDLSCCTGLKELPESFGQLKALTELNLTECTGLEELPCTFGGLEALQYLSLHGCGALKKLPSEFQKLRSLTYLNLSSCDHLESDICVKDESIKIVEKSEHSCTNCWQSQKLRIDR